MAAAILPLLEDHGSGPGDGRQRAGDGRARLRLAGHRRTARWRDPRPYRLAFPETHRRNRDAGRTGSRAQREPRVHDGPADRDRRPRLRRAAARDRVRRGRPRRRGHRCPRPARRRARTPAARRSTTSRTSDWPPRSGPALGRRVRPMPSLGRRRRDLRLRPDADHAVEGPRSRAGPVCRRPDPRAPAVRPARHPPVDDVPGDDDRAVPRGAGAIRPRGRTRLRPRLRPRAGQPRRPGQRLARASPARRRDDPGSDRPRRRAAPPHQRQRPRALARRTPRSWQSSSRTSSAT